MRKIVMDAWCYFWIFMTVFVVCDTYLYAKGNNTFFWQYKTDAELQLQQNVINKVKCEKE